MSHLFAEDWDDFERTRRPVFLDRVLLADRVAALAGVEKGFEFKDIKVDLDMGAGEIGGGGNGDGDAVTTTIKSARKNKEAEEPVAMHIEATDKHISFASAFALPAPRHWFQPIRESLLDFLALTRQQSKQAKKSVTYVSTQGRSTWEGKYPRLRDEDHAMLVDELRKTGNMRGWDVHVIELGDEGTPWVEQVRAAVESSVSSMFPPSLFLFYYQHHL